MTEENQHIGYYHFVVEPFHEDFTGHISWNLLGIRLLQCASKHAAAYGFGSVMAEQEACIWVLSRLTIEMNRRPATHQDYCIETWVDSIYRQFTNRYYRIVGADGTVYGTASSIWALIGRESRRPISLENCNRNIPPCHSLRFTGRRYTYRNQPALKVMPANRSEVLQPITAILTSTDTLTPSATSTIFLTCSLSKIRRARSAKN